MAQQGGRLFFLVRAVRPGGEPVAICRVLGTALVGIEAVVVEVEVDSRQGLPAILTVGLPDAAVRESEDRVRAAIRNSGVEFPMRRIAV